jgi:DNA-binding NtrC family response regulator
VSVNVAGLDDTVFSDTLFGHRKGAFTGAENDRPGLVRRAGAGTLFLDEIGDLSLQSQIKLLRLLESGEYYPLGTDIALRTNARVIAATNIDIDAAASEKRFRKDLLYRLKTHHVRLPPLRERVGDVRLLTDHFVAETARERGQDLPIVEEKAHERMGLHPFPGNVRELRALIVDAMSRCRAGRITASDLHLPEAGEASVASESVVVQFGRTLPTMKQVLDRLVDAALERSGGNQSVAARLIGVTPQAISGRLKRRRAG